MSQREALARHLATHFVEIDVERCASLGEHYRGKVRDLFIADDEITMITSDRLSAFDVVLTSIPCKGAILNAIAVYAFEQTADICPNHLISVPHPNVLKVRKAQALPIEVVVRRHVTGSFWRAYEKGEHTVYEVPVPDDLKKDQRLDSPIVTPVYQGRVRHPRRADQPAPRSSSRAWSTRPPWTRPSTSP